MRFMDLNNLRKSTTCSLLVKWPTSLSLTISNCPRRYCNGISELMFTLFLFLWVLITVCDQCLLLLFRPYHVMLLSGNFGNLSALWMTRYDCLPARFLFPFQQELVFINTFIDRCLVCV